VYKLFPNFDEIVADDDIDLELPERMAYALGVKDIWHFFNVQISKRSSD
jgi:hypothetical protein